MIKEIQDKLNHLIAVTESDDLHPYPTPKLLSQELKHLVDVYIHNRQDRFHEPLAPGRWVQVYEERVNPYYAKIKEIKDKNIILLEGVFNYENDSQKIRAVDKKIVIPVSYELSEKLEFENGMNIYKHRPYNMLEN